ncbi:hypothetical protein D3C78_1248780 [compost metagenome]
MTAFTALPLGDAQAPAGHRLPLVQLVDQGLQGLAVVFADLVRSAPQADADREIRDPGGQRRDVAVDVVGDDPAPEDEVGVVGLEAFVGQRPAEEDRPGEITATAPARGLEALQVASFSRLSATLPRLPSPSVRRW